MVIARAEDRLGFRESRGVPFESPLAFGAAAGAGSHAACARVLGLDAEGVRHAAERGAEADRDEREDDDHRRRDERDATGEARKRLPYRDPGPHAARCSERGGPGQGASSANELRVAHAASVRGHAIERAGGFEARDG